MEERGLRLLREEGVPAGAGTRPLALALAALLLAASAAATRLGADAARRVVDVETLARGTIEHALLHGSSDPSVRKALVEARRSLGRRPLDSRSRVTYAGLVLALASEVQDLRLAAFHARRAAELAPVTLSVTRSAARVLAQAGERRSGLELVHAMFRYEPDAAAELLGDLEPDAGAAEAWVADSPEARMAWHEALLRAGESQRASVWLGVTHERFPDHLPALEALAFGAMARGAWDDLERLLDTPLLGDPGAEAAPLLLARGRLAVARGDARAAREDVEHALRLGASRPALRILGGDVLQAAGATDLARAQWTRALHELPAGAAGERRDLLLRLARLEDLAGEPAKALRLWRRLLELEPDHEEARRRADDLSGFQR